MPGIMKVKSHSHTGAQKGSMGLAESALLRPASQECTVRPPGSLQEPQNDVLPPGEAAKPGLAGFVFI